ncbi:uncharacterized protein [Phaseolus vulgaris]|uniref:uncharacterized protein n=1 Tax=Phaseolus vulgaris TaxID=3885 RepID=UPI0035CBBC79
MSKQYVQSREVSDHCAVVAKSWVKDWGPRPFKTIDVWLSKFGFKDLVKGKWNNYDVQENRMSKLKDKLKFLKGDLKEWNRCVFGNLEESKSRITMEIEKLDVKDVECDLMEGENLRRLELLSQRKLLEKKVESLSRQKTRSTWFKRGDSNSKYYHSIIRWRKLRNEVKGVEIDNQWCEEPESVRGKLKECLNKGSWPLP